MSVNYAEPHVNDPLYQSALNHLQKGNWEQGILKLDQLILQYPLDHALRSLRQEMHLRARMDRDEEHDLVVQRRRRLSKWLGRIWAVILISALLIIGYNSASSFIEDKVNEARAVLEHEIALLELSAKFRDAEALLRADRPNEALVLLEEIAASDMEFPQLESTLEQARNASALIEEYSRGLQHYNQRNWHEASTIFEGILEQDPTFRDVSILLADIDKSSTIEQLAVSSDLYFDQEQWEDAVQGYESIRNLDPTFNENSVKERLFTSYVNAAKATLVDQADSLAALETAERYFRKALALRPQNPEIKTEREMAYLYLKAQTDFNLGLWSEVIAGLEIINSENPDYALGTARQTLYESYIARGDIKITQGLYEDALADYQRASTLASQDPEATLRIYEAHLKLAEVEGVQGKFETAIFHYRTAIDLSDVRSQILIESPLKSSALIEAESAAQLGNFSVAYEEYRKALGIIPGNICLSMGAYTEALEVASVSERIISHFVQAGEYVTMLANRYRSTVCAIVVANGLTDPDLIYNGQELLIPVLP